MNPYDFQSVKQNLGEVNKAVYGVDPFKPEKSRHKPNCASNLQCAVYHENGICPGYKKCDCGAEGYTRPSGFLKKVNCPKCGPCDRECDNCDYCGTAPQEQYES